MGRAVSWVVLQLRGHSSVRKAGTSGGRSKWRVQRYEANTDGFEPLMAVLWAMGHVSASTVVCAVHASMDVTTSGPSPATAAAGVP